MELIVLWAVSYAPVFSTRAAECSGLTARAGPAQGRNERTAARREVGDARWGAVRRRGTH